MTEHEKVPFSIVQWSTVAFQFDRFPLLNGLWKLQIGVCRRSRLYLFNLEKHESFSPLRIDGHSVVPNGATGLRCCEGPTWHLTDDCCPSCHSLVIELKTSDRMWQSTRRSPSVGWLVRARCLPFQFLRPWKGIRSQSNDTWSEYLTCERQKP